MWRMAGIKYWWILCGDGALDRRITTRCMGDTQCSSWIHKAQQCSQREATWRCLVQDCWPTRHCSSSTWIDLISNWHSLYFKIGHITCDNASNNNTMMEFFAKYIEKRTKKPFLFEDRRIRWDSTPCVGRQLMWSQLFGPCYQSCNPSLDQRTLQGKIL